MKTISITALAAFLAAGPGVAGPVVTPTEVRMAQVLKLDPGKYSLNELMQIAAESGGERSRRIAIIDRQHAAFRDRVQSVIDSGGDPYAN